ncbi:MAG TPA: NUDIX hydrolase [Candidatus Limnocylindria bacterium]|nr:NUDIX hydrolase [Candidatus Limnocylindria bacterium]
MTKNIHPLSQKEFNAIYSKVPRLTIEIIVRNEKDAIYLTKRAIQPCKGQWHLPGGTVHFGEPMIDAVKRIALRELGIEVKDVKSKSYIEYPSHFKNGLDSPVGIVFEVTRHAGALNTNEESESGGWFKKLPENMHADQDEFLLRNGYLHQ